MCSWSSLLRVLLLLPLMLVGVGPAPAATSAAASAADCPRFDDDVEVDRARLPDLRAFDHDIPFGDPAFQRVWQRNDGPVATGVAQRTWLWGPEPWRYALNEEYVESRGGSRRVQYFDKGRMEISDPNGDPSDPYYVTMGLLVVELMIGCLQLGDRLFLAHAPSTAQVAGDQQPASLSPTYAALARVRDTPALPLGAEIRQMLDGQGNVGAGGPAGVTAAHYVPQTGHSVASVFWELLQSEGLVDGDDGDRMTRLFEPTFYATGYPITEAYWAIVLVRGRPARVLIQAFERRVLTYTPGNPPGFEVEAGNVGQHYYRWRHEG